MPKEIVTPGELIGIEEEFLGNENTVADNGNLYSLVLGEKKLINRQMQVYSPKLTRMLKQGDLVIGRVTDLYDSVSLIVIEWEKNPIERAAIGGTYAYMRITELVRGGGYVKNFRQYIKIGDIVKARVIEVNPLGTYLTIAEDSLGVVKSYCSLCHEELSERGRLLICPECGNKENRKLAIK
jgi:exosome complex component CSL4